MEKGMHGGIPKLRRLSLLEYLLGMHGGIPKLERLTLPNLLSSSSIAHLKTPFIHMSGPGICVCNSSHNSIIWRAESRTHFSKQTRPSAEHSQKASYVRASHPGR